MTNNNSDASKIWLLLQRYLIFSTISFIILAIFFFNFGLRFSFWRETTTIWYGYAVDDDRRIYMVNLNEGKLKWTSEPLGQIGNPTEIDLDRDKSILYIGSGPEFIGRARGYVPLVAVSLKEVPEILLESWVDPAYSPESDMNEPPIYYLKFSPESGLLHNSLGSRNYPSRRIVYDPTTESIIGQNDAFITKDFEFSPDGKFVAEIHPGLSREIANGIPEFPGIVIVWDLETGEQISRTEHENNRNLYPPWGASNDRLVHVRRNRLFNRLEVFDRDSGELLALHEFRETFDFGAPTQYHHATPIPKSDDVAMTFGGSVVVFDPITAEVKSRTYVSDSILTEVVVTDKPLLRTDITEFGYRDNL